MVTEVEVKEEGETSRLASVSYTPGHVVPPPESSPDPMIWICGNMLPARATQAEGEWWG